MPLTDIKIKNAKPKEKPYKLADGEGMYLLVNPNGSKYWRLKYRINGKEKTHAIGVYPQKSLTEARDDRFEAKKLIRVNIDPVLNKKAEFAETENTFEAVGKDWFKKNKAKWTEGHEKKLNGWLEKDVYPEIGSIPIAEIKSPDILRLVQKIESRGALDVARRVLSLCSQILRYAIPQGLCDYDVTAGINKTLSVRKRRNFKCINVEEFPELLKRIDSHNCNLKTKLGLKLIAYTFVRSGELRFAKWSEFNFENKEWRIPAERMKMKELHIVPLSNQVIDILKQLKLLSGDSDYILPNENNPNKVMSENTMLYALYDMNYHNKMTVHGFRQLASTILNEKGYNKDAIERQLSHAERDNVRRAYNHAEYLLERRKMMQDWANYIDGLRG